MSNHTYHHVDEAGHKHISAAIAAAEKGTSGEIYAVLARRSDDYFFAAGFVFTCGILLSTVVMAFLAHYYWFDIALPRFGLAILGAFICAMLLLWFIPSLRVLLVPRRILYKRAHLNAMQQFLARNVHLTSQRTGILLFVSLAEHYAEVVADAGIHAKVDQAEWNAIVGVLMRHAKRGAVSDGFVEAIALSEQLLKTHFPDDGNSKNELEDKLVEL
ncbi:TPM domain-containing protein [Paenochrobactrum glaciei]|uniref:TPM domain-containing protein n=1 Tax=Paenochrobactrum glaciei TaxID=486407 RepID=A0ABN1GFD0_9HYPH